MENWEFLLQRKGDKSWLPLESPTVEILEGQYRLAARSDLANASVGIAISYRPLADVRHEPIQQKLVKRVSHDGLLIVMPYTSFVPGLWQINCAAVDTDTDLGAWVKTVKFDVIQVSTDSFSEWQYNDNEEDLESPAEIITDTHVNALGITQTEPVPLSYGSPILDIAEQRSTELVQSMFDEFAIFGDESGESENGELATTSSANVVEQSDELIVEAIAVSQSNQPRALLRLAQTQYIVNQNNRLTLIGEAYTKGEITVILKDPQTLDLVVEQRYQIANLESNLTNGVIPFSYEVLVPPPSEIQVLIGEVQIYPNQDFQQYSDLFIMQQMIAVSYPASRVLPEMIKEAQKYSAQDLSEVVEELPPSRNLPKPTEKPNSKTKPANALSLPPLPSRKSKANKIESNLPKSSLSLPPLPPIANKQSGLSENLEEIDELQQIEAEFALTDLSAETINDSISTDEEPELQYSFEEELPHNYEELLEQQRLENLQDNARLPLLPNSREVSGSRNRNNRFLNKLQTLSADAIAAQKASQRSEELLLENFPPSDPDISSEDLSAASIDLDNPSQSPRTIAESSSLAELDLELDLELDRLLVSEPDLILNEYVWEETIDPNSFPIQGVMTPSSTASALSETAQTIRNLQDSSPQALPEQEPIPIPEILIPAGELISGTPMLVIVRLPAIAPKFFVKFWIKDLQTRMIVDGPRWLLDFKTVANTEFIETQTNASIPLSSIDVAFEAIAIEAQTQRESHKSRVVRAVVPPNLA
ncbi:hypothetical protein HCU40_12330 [Pseudanabaena biceps]|nr:hypothetical protein [Pseudanabaena biceps]